MQDVSRGVRIIDTTLREGSQSPGVNFTLAQSLEIAQMLASLGVDQIECGHPAASPAQMERVSGIAALGLPCPILGHARARRDDIDAVARSGASWVGIFVGVNEITRSARIVGTSLGDLLHRIEDAVCYARSLGLRVRYTLEDASRTDELLAFQAFQAALDAGADRICFADTLGLLEPESVARCVAALKGQFVHSEIELHLHNDRGLAMAGALAGIDAGADWVSASVNGLGERVGITDLCGLLVNLHYRSTRPLSSGPGIQEVSTCVAAYARCQVPEKQPITGRHAFTHTARLHVRAIQFEKMAYNWIPPELVGQHMYLDEPGLPREADAFFLSPKVISSTELPYHREGPGVRHVMFDERFLPDCRQYCIVREIPRVQRPTPHVDVHIHTTDSFFLFLGHEPGLRGLQVEVVLGEVTREISSPASVFIPAGVPHTYRIISGEGIYVNHVLKGSYTASLLKPHLEVEMEV